MQIIIDIPLDYSILKITLRYEGEEKEKRRWSRLIYNIYHGHKYSLYPKEKKERKSRSVV